MPAPLRVDWNIAKRLYFGGLSLQDISKRTGISYPAIRQHALRHKWKTESETISQQIARSVADTVTAVAKRDTRDMLKQGDAWRRRIVSLTERHLQAVEGRDPATLQLSDFETLCRITDTTDRIARRSFGLDVAQGPTLTVHVQSDLGTVKPPAQLGPGQIVDVETVQSETKMDTSTPETPK